MNWVLVWVLLTIASLGYLGFLLFRLARKGAAAYQESKPLIAQVLTIADAATTKTLFEKPMDNLLDDVNVHLIERATLLKMRRRAAEQRQRRLIENLKDFDSQESELKNGRT